jgi:hemoglobin
MADAVSHFEQIGGAAAVRLAVGQLYDRILADAELAPYFAGTDMPRQRAHMAALLTKVLGGPDGYTGRGLGEAHHGLGITTSDYRRVVDHLVAVLTGLDVPEHVIDAVGAVAAGAEPDIVEVAG